MDRNLFQAILFLVILNYLSVINAQDYLKEKIERILGETRRIRFLDRFAEDRYLHCRVNQCLNQYMININQRRRQIGQARRNNQNKKQINARRQQISQSQNILIPRKKNFNQNINQIYTI